MKLLIISVLVLICTATTVAQQGALESGVNLIEILLIPFTADQTTSGGSVIGGPFLLLFAIVCGLEFVAKPLVATLVASVFGGLLLRKSQQTLSKRAAWLCVGTAAILTAALAFSVAQRTLQLPISLPGEQPKTSTWVLALASGLNAALSMLVGTYIIRRLGAQTPTHVNSTASKG